MKTLITWSLAFASVALLAQPSNDSLNMTKLTHYPTSQWTGIPVGNGMCNDIWGYTDSATGTEYAIVGNEKGTLVAEYNTSNQFVPQLWVPGATSVWRDLKTWDHYAYVMHDITGQSPDGLLIIDLDSLAQARWKYVKLPWLNPTTQQYDTLGRSHNLWVDEQGILYAFGADIGAAGGAVMIDVATDPWNPTIVGNYDQTYFHDGYARNDTLYGAALWSGIVVLDVTLKSNPLQIGQFQTPGSFAHNCWLSDDGHALYTTDEITGGFIAGYDVSDLSNVTEYFRTRPQPGTGVIPHNAHVDGNHLVSSYYTFGVHVLDVEYPEMPLLVGYYDTSPMDSGGYNGAWGAYPYLPSGRVLVSDRQTGLWGIAPDYPSVSRAKIQLGHTFYGPGAPASTYQYSNLMGNDFVYWYHGGDTIFADGDGVIEVLAMGAIQDSLVYPLTCAGCIDGGKVFSLGSGQLVVDTIVAYPYASTPELDMSHVQYSDKGHFWELQSSIPSRYDVTLNDVHGRMLWSGEWTRWVPLHVPKPQDAGMYWLSFFDRESGRKGIIKVVLP